EEFMNSGIRLNSELSPQLLLTIFFPKTELHDGAVILRGDRLVAAAAVLPLSAAHGLTQRKLGTRHRASMGMTEISDAIVVVVSEETGQISVANNGRLIRRLDTTRLATILQTFYADTQDGGGEQHQSVRRTLERYMQDWRTNRSSEPNKDDASNPASARGART
ncbi:MAG: diadenylate cyclase, partial [Anaerolineales bacterium]